MAIIAVTQPLRYGGTKKAKTPVMFLDIKGPLPVDPTVGRYHLACFGNKGHYCRETGVCIHVETWAGMVSPWHRARARFLPFGDKNRGMTRLPAILRRDSRDSVS